MKKDDWNFVDISTLIKNVCEIRQELECSFLKIKKEYLISDNGIEENFADAIYINMQRINAIHQYENHFTILYENHNLVAVKGKFEYILWGNQ